MERSYNPTSGERFAMGSYDYVIKYSSNTEVYHSGTHNYSKLLAAFSYHNIIDMHPTLHSLNQI